jgi:hypothetical protein
MVSGPVAAGGEPEPRLAPLAGTNFRISGAPTTASDETPAVVWNPIAREYLVVWEDWRDLSSRGSDIYGQRVSAGGSLLGPNFRISGGAADGSDRDPAVVWNQTANEYLVVWDDGRDLYVRGSDIYGQRVDAGGTLLGFNLRICGAAAYGYEDAPAVAWNETANEYLVVWQDERNKGNRGPDIYAQRVAADGKLMGFNRRISGAAGTGYDEAPAVAWNQATNQYLVVWQDARNFAARGSDIYAQRVAADGKLVGFNRRISGRAATDSEVRPEVVWNRTANQYFVVWQDWRTGDSDIYGQRVGAGGGLVGFNRRISGAATTSDNYRPTLAWNETANQYLVVWSDFRNSGTRGADIYGQRVDPDGALVGFNFRISGAAATDDDYEPAVAWNRTADQYLVVWTDERSYPTRNADIYGQRVTGS